MSRVCLLKLKIHIKIQNCLKKKPEGDDLEEEEEEVEEVIDGYSAGCSITTDFMVIMAFVMKFRYSQLTNYHDLDGILNDNYLGANEEQYIELTHFADYYMEQY